MVGVMTSRGVGRGNEDEDESLLSVRSSPVTRGFS